jgi:hypothetical protein
MCLMKMQLRQLLFVFALSLAYNCKANAVTSATISPKAACVSGDSSCRRYRLVIQTFMTGDSSVKTGIIVRNKFIECIVSLEKQHYGFAFGHQGVIWNGMDCDCAAIQPDKLFNGHLNGKRVGIWFGWYPWGSIRRAEWYVEGRLLTRIFFRPNGNIRRILRYKNGKIIQGSQKIFNKKGYSEN